MSVEVKDLENKTKRKKRVLWHSNLINSPTGFGQFIKEIMLYLHKTGKYELCNFGAGTSWDNPDFARWPFLIHGTIPNNPQEWNELQRDPNLGRSTNYGSYYIDRIISEFKPDCYIGSEDPWGNLYCVSKPWWNRIHSILHLTYDSVPLYDECVEKSNLIKHHYSWSNFSVREYHRLAKQLEEVIDKQEKELLKLSPEIQKANESNFQNWKKNMLEKVESYKRVKLLRGSVNTDVFKNLGKSEKIKLRQKFKIPLDCFCVGFLSRNQLRKLLPNLIEGFKLFKQNNPKLNTKLLTYTSWIEGWSIQKLMRDNGLSQDDVLASYKCKVTNELFILPYQGENINNPVTGHEKSLVTVSVTDCLPVEKINEFYNVLDLLCHPITSGAQERCLQEAKLCELITLVNPYSCGEDNCVPEAFSLPLDFSTYREFGSQFIKATVYPSSIAKQLQKVLEMPIQKREEWGKKARQWVLDNFSIEVIGKKFEDLLDSLPIIEDYDFNFQEKPKNPDAIIPEESDDSKWITSLYKLILNMTVKSDDSGKTHWETVLKQGVTRKQIYDYFVGVAKSENEKNKVSNKIELKDLLDNNGRKRYLFVIKESAGDCYLCTSLFESIKTQYPDHDLYVATDPIYFDIFKNNPYIHRVIPYEANMESEIWACGSLFNQEPLFQAYCHVAIASQRHLNYISREKSLLLK